jgi:hypothetical protein
MPDIYTPYNDRYRIFTWWWSGSQWIVQEPYSSATAHDRPGAQAALASTRHGVRGWANTVQPGWYYLSIYYWNDQTWVFQEGSPEYVAPMPGLVWSGEGGTAPLLTPTGDKMPSSSPSTPAQETAWGPIVALAAVGVLALGAILIMKGPSYGD